MEMKPKRPEYLAEDVPWAEECSKCPHVSEKHHWDSLKRKYKNCAWCNCEKFTSKG